MKGIITLLFCLVAAIGTAGATAFSEQDFEVTDGQHRLPGTLCLPEGEARATVVFVHGSGPQDRNETLGPNRYFEELAHALAKEGIASLRYDKRTFVERRADAGITYRGESVDDAVTAIRLLHGAGHRHIYVAGHSLGGHLAPLIVEDAREWLEGAVILSGNAFTLAECIRMQMEYLGKQQGAGEALIQNSIERMLSALPKAYLDFDRDYNATRHAAKMAKELPQMRWMVVQGGHDYQVTLADYSQWMLALGQRATYFYGETLDHLLRPLPAMATPQDYQQEGHVAPEATAAIAAFILKKQ